ncbi:MAG: DUF3883 domain-containing protein [Terriglobales bacterium]
MGSAATTASAFRRHWTPLEVEATVADYLDMLECELRGQPYSKTEHRRMLLRLLYNRTESAIELKHQNISAILIERGLPYLAGYKPRRNYQHLLAEVVTTRLQGRPRLLSTIAERAIEPADLPVVDDILRALVAPPQRDSRSAAPPPAAFREHVFPDYLAQEAQNRSLGAAGEKFVVRFEIARLLHGGHKDLAASVQHVSASRGDGAGYDILSFEESGKERLIEVKTTAFGRFTPFYLSRNELEVSRIKQDTYFLYRAFEFRSAAKLFMRRGALDREFALEPDQWIATP